MQRPRSGVLCPLTFGNKMKTSDTAMTRNYGVYVALIPAVAILAAWSFGISALIRKEYDPAIPQWIVVIAVAAAIIGALMLVGRLLRTSTGQQLTKIGVACLLIPLIAVVFGGIYLWASERIARNREPGSTVIQGVGLGITVFGFGIATAMEVLHMVLVFTGSLVGLIAFRLSSRQAPMSLMRFGALHFLTFFAAMVVASIEDQQRQMESRGQPPTHETKAEQGGAGNPAKPGA